MFWSKFIASLEIACSCLTDHAASDIKSRGRRRFGRFEGAQEGDEAAVVETTGSLVVCWSGSNQGRALKLWYVQRGTLNRERQGDAVCETEDAGTEEGRCGNAVEARSANSPVLEAQTLAAENDGEGSFPYETTRRWARGSCRGNGCSLANGEEEE